jgi:hypothetical protein
MGNEERREPDRHFAEAEFRGSGTVTVNLVTQVSTSANASFDKFVSDFTKRISDKADELFGPGPRPENTASPKGE